MDCLNDEILSAYIDGETDPVESCYAEKHLNDCEKCLGGARVLISLKKAVRKQAVPAAPSDLLESLEGLAAESSAWSQRPIAGGQYGWVRTAAWISSFACAALTFLLWHQTNNVPVDVSAEFFHTAHEQYVSSMPLAIPGITVAKLPEEAFEEEVAQTSNDE